MLKSGRVSLGLLEEEKPCGRVDWPRARPRGRGEASQKRVICLAEGDKPKEDEKLLRKNGKPSRRRIRVVGLAPQYDNTLSVSERGTYSPGRRRRRRVGRLAEECEAL